MLSAQQLQERFEGDAQFDTLAARALEAQESVPPAQRSYRVSLEGINEAVINDWLDLMQETGVRPVRDGRKVAVVSF